MKLNTAEAARFCREPSGGRSGALIYGPDAQQTAERRESLVRALVGADGEDEMRVERMTGAELRADPTRLDAALRARGFFAGPRIAVVTGAMDGLADTIAAALAEAATPDAFLLATADSLTPRSALRRLFEDARNAVAAPCYGDAPDRGRIAEIIADLGARAETAALDALEARAGDLGSGSFARLLEVVTLHARDHGGPVTAEDVYACAGAQGAADAEAAIDAALDGDVAALRVALARLRAQGAGQVEICLAALRRIRQLHNLAILDEAAARTALERIQPRARRDRIAAALRRRSISSLERTLALLIQTDAALRGGSAAPSAALLERALLRIAGNATR